MKTSKLEYNWNNLWQSVITQLYYEWKLFHSAMKQETHKYGRKLRVKITKVIIIRFLFRKLFLERKQKEGGSKQNCIYSPLSESLNHIIYSVCLSVIEQWALQFYLMKSMCVCLCLYNICCLSTQWCISNLYSIFIKKILVYYYIQLKS